jgi:hypothetical protein
LYEPVAADEILTLHIGNLNTAGKRAGRVGGCHLASQAAGPSAVLDVIGAAWPAE